MTVIAWDGETLAADRQRSMYNTPIPCRKVFRINAPDGSRYLVGCAGDSFGIATYIRWAQGKGDRPITIGDTNIMSIDESRRVWLAERELNWVCLGKRKWAIGCGADYALAVMTFGGTAVEGIRVASKLDHRCGLGVNTVGFEPVIKRPAIKQ